MITVAKERPIIAYPHEVRAILDNRQTQFRRVIKTQNDNQVVRNGYYIKLSSSGLIWKPIGGQPWEPFPQERVGEYCPYGQKGDRLSVIELRPIPESPNDDYMAGSDGQVYSRTRYAGFGRKDYVDWYPLQGTKSSKGYQTVSLCHQNKKVTKTIHRLICSAFYGLPSAKNLQVRHLDGNELNNKPENLAWGTQSENWQDRKVHGNGIEGDKHHNAKFSNEEREHIRWAVSCGLCSARNAAKVLGVSPSTISQIMGASELDIASVEILDRYKPVTLEVLSVRVERLQDISEEDAIAEGCKPTLPDGLCTEDPTKYFGYKSAQANFAELWNSINESRGYSWDINPWVWCVEFKSGGSYEASR